MLATALGLVVLVSLLIGVAFWRMGAPWVLPFAGLESLLVVAAFVVHARSVADCDEIHLSDDTLLVRQERRGQVQEQRFPRSYVRVTLVDKGHPKVQVAAAGREVELGPWLRPAASRALYRQLRQDLPAAPAHACVQGLLQALAPHGVRLQPLG